MRFFTSLITACSDIKGKPRKVSAAAAGYTVTDRKMMQQAGFTSIPVASDRVLFLQYGNMTIGIASESADRPSLEAGERAMHRSSDHYIILKKDGSIAIKAESGVDIDGDLRVTGDIEGKGEVSDLIGKLSTLRNKHNLHMHVGNMGTETSPPMADGQDTGA